MNNICMNSVNRHRSEYVRNMLLKLCFTFLKQKQKNIEKVCFCFPSDSCKSLLVDKLSLRKMFSGTNERALMC